MSNENTCCGDTWLPTYCNHGHCAWCFSALSRYHDDCCWDGSEHESYGPSSRLPGDVYVRGDEDDDD